MDAVHNMLISYVYNGLPYKYYDDKIVELFEYGFARLEHNRNGNQVTIDEPLVVCAGLKFFEGNRNTLMDIMPSTFSFVTDQMSRWAYNPSELGYLWEEYLPKHLVRYFREERNLVVRQSGEGYSPNVIFLKHSDDYGLPEYLAAPKATFFFPENDAGPDIVFFVNDGKSSFDIPVFVQCKFKKKVDSVTKAIRTTYPEFFYCNKNGVVKETHANKKEKILALQNLKDHGYHAMFVCFPHRILQRRFVPHRTSVNRLTEIVLHRDNISQLFPEADIEFLLNLKGVHESDDA
jgi:hypothetical protein